jgi:CheY-like chemotaxis protein
MSEMAVSKGIFASGISGDIIRITCITSSTDLRNLIRKSSHFKDIKVRLQFLNLLSDLTEDEEQMPDILVMEIRGTADEERFFKLLHESRLDKREIFILCSGASAKEWHTFVMEREITDYLTIRPLHDPNRLRIQLRQAVERCSIRRMLSVAMSSGDESSSGIMRQPLPTVNSPFAFFEGLVEHARSSANFLPAIFGVADSLQEMKKASASDDDRRAAGPEARLLKYGTTVSGPSSKKVLIIEDDEMSATVEREVLDERGYEVLREASLGKAIMKYQRVDFALAIVALMAPGINGPEGIRLLQKKLFRGHTPVLVSSVHSEDELVRKVAGLGITGFLLKPIDRQRLAREIDNIKDSRMSIQADK